MQLRDIWDFINLGQFDPINRMIPLTVIPLSSAHIINYSGRRLMGSRLMVSAADWDQIFIGHICYTLYFNV